MDDFSCVGSEGERVQKSTTQFGTIENALDRKSLHYPLTCAEDAADNFRYRLQMCTDVMATNLLLSSLKSDKYKTALYIDKKQ